MSSDLAALVAALRSPAAYYHPADAIEVFETHISYVVLAGPFAYKLKKPVELGFLDYSTLELRRRACEDEVRLNRRTAPDLYLGVVPISGTPDRPVVGGPGPVREYAVRMRRFDPGQCLDVLAREHRLKPSCVDALASEVARLHDGAETMRGPFGCAPSILRSALENIDGLLARLASPSLRAECGRLAAWTLAEFTRTAPVFDERRRAGRIRECHGDLHLANVVVVDGRPLAFDCIEFNEGLRAIDVVSDMAFTAMDLHAHGYPGLAARFLSGYFEATGDYRGLEVLRFYLVYRALVRAKVAAIRAGQGSSSEAVERYVQLALRLTERGTPALVLMHGVSGSGKSTTAATLVERLHALRVRSDVVRKRLHGFDPLERSGAGLGTGVYAPAATERTHRILRAQAAQILRAGYPAIVDATFLERRHRTMFRELADELGVPFGIVECAAPEAVLRARIAARERDGGDASEAGVRVLEAQLARREPLDEAERAALIPCDTGAPWSWRPPCATSTSSTATPTASARSTS